jgi:hypothetical protein
MIKDENVRNFIKEELPEVKDVDSLKFGGIVELVQRPAFVNRVHADHPPIVLNRA